MSEPLGNPQRLRVLPTGTVAFLFTDVEGSTRLWTADAEAMSRSLLTHDSILRGVIEANGGYVFTTAGDLFAAAFQRATDALRAAAESQLALGEAVWPGPALRVRMAVHLGEAEERSGDYFGPVVNLASRVEAAGHGGQVLITEAVRLAASLNAEVAADLGVHHLRDVKEPIRLFQVGPGAFPPLRAVDPGSSNLPVRPTRLVGRNDEVHEVRQLLSSNRLVTITAVGGAGKTRLAIAVGELELRHHTGGVWFVDLTKVSKDAEVAGSIASALGLNLTVGDPTAQVIEFLVDKESLVILDNCEHLLRGCAEFSERFLARRGAASILATSREAINVSGEQTVVLRPLVVDGADAAAIQLFLDRASAVGAQLHPNDADTAMLVTICSRLDGLPLAIELAAARTTVMSLTELLAGLDDRFQLLSGGRRSQHLRTLEATLDWSYDLLDSDEQRMLRALGVFVDGFNLPAACAVTNTCHADALDLIEALVAKSLVVRSDQNDSVRFRLLETVKAYAEHRLKDAGEEPQVRSRHLDHYHRSSTVHGRTIGAELHLCLGLRADRCNLAAAFEYAAADGRWITAGELLLGSSGVYDLESAWLDGAIMLDCAIEHCEEHDVDLAERLKAIRLEFLVLTFDPRLLPLLIELCRSPVEAVRAVGWAYRAFLVGYLGHDSRPAIERTRQQLDQLTGSDRATAATHAGAYLHIALAFDAIANSDLESAQTCFDQALALCSEYAIGGDLGISTAGAAVVQILLGQPELALHTISKIETFRLPHARGDDIRALANIALGNLTLAATDVRKHASRAVSGRFIGEEADSVVLLAALSFAEGETDRACELFAALTVARTPAGNIYAEHLACQLDLLGTFHSRRQEWFSSSSQQQIAQRARALNELRAEIARRGWR